jgi:hypothetical protein
MGVTTMNVFRKVAVATFALATIAPLAAVADKADVITGEVTPGVYGRVDTAKNPKPTLVYEHPMFIEAPAAGNKVEPLYLHVPPDHAKNWKKHCKQYDACNVPVYFVKSAEYEPGYEPPKPEAAQKPSKRKFRSGW